MPLILQDLFTSGSLEAQLRNANPWWRGERQYDIPPFKRWAFDLLKRGVKRPLAPATVLRGPRQIGNSFIEKAHYNAPFGVLATLRDELGTDDPRIVSMPLSSFLLLR